VTALQVAVIVDAASVVLANASADVQAQQVLDHTYAIALPHELRSFCPCIRLL
jgi:hypothetical protein